MHHTVNIGGLTVPAVPHHLPLADVDLGEGKRNGGAGAVSGGQSDQRRGLSPQGSVLTDEAGHVCLEIVESYQSWSGTAVQLILQRNTS